jgi:hypothetical protein
MPRIVPFTVIAAMFLCLVLGNSRTPNECPIHHAPLRVERMPVEYADKVFIPAETELLKQNPYTGFSFGGSASTIFRLHTTKVAICSQCRSNYLVGTSLSGFYVEKAVDLSSPQTNLDSAGGSADGGLFRNTQ